MSARSLVVPLVFSARFLFANHRMTATRACISLLYGDNTKTADTRSWLRNGFVLSPFGDSSCVALNNWGNCPPELCLVLYGGSLQRIRQGPEYLFPSLAAFSRCNPDALQPLLDYSLQLRKQDGDE